MRQGNERGPRETFAERRARRAEIDDPAVVLEAALRFLEARHRSVAEVRRRLTTAGYRTELIDGALGRLGDLGILDDQAFASQWVESRDRARPRGERALQAELRRKGVDPDTISRTLDDRRGPGIASAGEGPGVEILAARRLLARHAAALSRVSDPRVRRQRAYALLARNGFAPDVAGEVARSLEPTGEEGLPPDD
ncbi:MAG: regulatory protein RecX [Chloroflexi bacterium]|nr:regulatory protein RecX [Chloroflexota bacterium]